MDQTVDFVCRAVAGELSCTTLGGFPGGRILVDDFVLELPVIARFVVESKLELLCLKINVFHDILTLFVLRETTFLHESVELIEELQQTFIVIACERGSVGIAREWQG